MLIIIIGYNTLLMTTPDCGYENVLRSHQIIADLQALHRNQVAEAGVTQQTGRNPARRSRRSMELEFQAHVHGASGEAIKRAGMVENIYAKFFRIVELNERSIMASNPKRS